MTILVCNDDGIHAPGLAHLCAALKPLGEVKIVAPAAEQSGVGHAITFATPLRTRTVMVGNGLEGLAVSGTPADCVKLAVCELLAVRPALLVSGINLGANTGISVVYSGTVSAAVEGAIMGIPSMAISLCAWDQPLWETAAHVAARLAAQLADHGLPSGVMLNVNVPNLPLARVRSMALTRMGRSRFNEKFERRVDPRGGVYYWLDGELTQLEPDDQTDIRALEEDRVSITPIAVDFTSAEGLRHLAGWNLGLQ